MKKSNLPLTILNAKKIRTSQKTLKYENYICIHKLQTKQAVPFRFYRPI